MLYLKMEKTLLNAYSGTRRQAESHQKSGYLRQLGITSDKTTRHLMGAVNHGLHLFCICERVSGKLIHTAVKLI